MRKRLRFLFREVSACRISVHAGNAAFFLLLSLLPLGVLLSVLLPLIPIASESLRSAAEELIPGSDALFLYVQVSEKPHAVLSLSVLGTVWSASRGTYGILCGLDRAFAIPETRSALRIRLACAMETLLLLAAVLAALGIYVRGKIFRQFGGCGFISSCVHLLATFLFLALLFLLIYRILPDHRPAVRFLLPGALFSAAGWMFYSALYVRLLRISGDGALSDSLSPAASALWLYGCIQILFFGAVVCRAFSDKTDR